MKSITISGLQDDRLIRPLEHIGNLFFEDTKVTFTPEDEAEIVIQFDVSEEEDQVFCGRKFGWQTAVQL